MDLPACDRYLRRLGVAGPLPVTYDSLERLHVAHMMSVPFENLSVMLGEAVRLDEDALLDKLLARRRGGFCYELNGAFALLLRALGFEVDLLAGEVGSEQGYGPPFDHLLLRVGCDDGDYLADVGFGDSFLRPIGLSGDISLQHGVSYRLLRDGDARILERRLPGSGWRGLYRFRQDVYDIAAFEPMCRFHQHDPASHFTRNLICSRARPDGRITLSGARLIVTLGGDRLEQPIADAGALQRCLQRHFAIEVTEGQAGRLLAAGRGG